MLAHDLLVELDDVEVTALSRSELDITDAAAVDSAVRGHDVVVNTAAFTRVDDAETEIDAAMAVNATGAGLLAEASQRHGARLVQLSTDYVFDGTASIPYSEDSPISPLSVYGRSKAEGEHLVLAAQPSALVLRTSWLYGVHGPNFVSAILAAAARENTLRVLTDQHGQPTWTVDVARQVRAAVAAGIPGGIYHATNAGQATRFEFAQEILRLAGLDPERVEPAEPGQMVRPAPRPAYSVLGHDKWAATPVPPLRDWREALADAAAHGVLLRTG